MCAHTMSVKALIVAKKMEKMTQGTTPCCSIAQGYDSSPAPAAAMNKFTQADSSTLERTRVMHCSAAFILENFGLQSLLEQVSAWGSGKLLDHSTSLART